MIAKSKFAKIVAGIVGFTMAFSFVVTPVTASAATAAELQAQINSLLATIQALQSQLSSSTGGTTTTTGYTFNTNLTMGSKGTDVMNLQKVLNAIDGTQLATVGAGSPGNETSAFGGLTRTAVIKFQQKYGITPAVGYVGAITRAKLNSMGGSVVVVPPVVIPGNPQGGSLTVSMASQPANSLAPQGASRIPFTTLTLTAGSADITVNSITVERAGLAQNAVFSGVVLLDSNGMQIGVAKTLNSNNQAMVGEPWTIKAGTSQTVTVAGNMSSTLTSFAGQVVGLNVVAVNTSASVSGSLPIMGAMHTVNASLALGSATLAISSFDPNSAQTKEIGTTGYKFAGVRVTAGSAEKVKLNSIRLNQVGSAGSNDLANVMVYLDGTAYNTTVSADGKYYSAVFPGGISIDKGFSKDIYVQGDIVGSNTSGRTVQFDINRTTDIYLTGETYMYGITPTASTVAGSATTASEFLAGTPFFSGSLVTVQGGSVTTIQKATSVAAQNLAVNVPNQILGGFTTDLKGEAISVQSMIFTVSTTTGNTFALTNVTIVDANGAVVAGPVDQVGFSLTFTDTVTFPVGQKTYTLKGKLASATPNNTTFSIASTPSSQWTNVTGQTTGNTVSLSGAGIFTMNTMTVRAASLAVSVSATPSAQSIVAGSQGVTFANYQFDASQSGEDVRLSSLALTNTGGNTGATSCQLFDGTTALNSGSNVVSTSAATNTFTLDQQLVIAKGTVKTLTLKCNISSSATGTFQWGIAGAQITAIAVSGVTSSNSVVATGNTGAGQIMTIGAGSIAITTPTIRAYSLASAGTTGNTIASFTFKASNEAINLNKLGLRLSNTASSSAASLLQVSVWDGSVQVGTALFTGSNMVATSTFASPVLLPKDADKVLTIKADFAAIGTAQPGVQGHLIAIDINSADTTGTEGNGTGSGSTVNLATVGSSVSTTVIGVRVFKSIPTLALGTLPITGIADGKLIRFTVAADASGNIGINQFKFTIATSTITGVTNVNLFGFDQTGAVLGGFSAGQISSSNVQPGASGAVTITPSSVINVEAGKTYTFELRGSVAGTQTGSSVTTTLVGDSSYPSLASFMGTSATLVSGGSSFVWSPNATTTSTASHVDWTNGFNVAGFPSSGIIQTRSL